MALRFYYIDYISALRCVNIQQVFELCTFSALHRLLYICTSNADMLKHNFKHRLQVMMFFPLFNIPCKARLAFQRERSFQRQNFI